MTVAAAIAFLTELFEAAPVFEAWWQRLMVAYVEKAKERIKKENRDAIKKALATDDQRTIEEQIGSPTAGKPSGEPSAVIVDDLPGVLRFEKRDSGKHLAE
jgi:hypothetical protein